MSPIQLDPGATADFTVVLNTATEDTIDWSFTAWGTDGPVSVTNKNPNIGSDSYPTLETPRSTPSEIVFPEHA